MEFSHDTKIVNGQMYVCVHTFYTIVWMSVLTEGQRPENSVSHLLSNTEWCNRLVTTALGYRKTIKLIVIG